MLRADEIEALRDAATDLLRPVIEYLLRDIAERIAKAGQLTATAQYETWKLQQLGVSQRDLRTYLKKALKVSNAKLRQLLTQSAEAGYNYDLSTLPTVRAIPFDENEAVQQIVRAAIAQTQGTLENLTQTLGMVDPYGHVNPLRDTYRKCMDYAFEQVSSGAVDYNTAIREATRNLAAKGVEYIDYESGVTTSLEAAVRRNIMGALGLMQEQISQHNHDQYGATGWEIDAHSNSAPDHEPIQGKQYTDAEYEALNNSLVRRIGTLNCGHSAHPIVYGASVPQYTPEDLEEMRQKNEKGITFRGKHYTGYEATQKQRRLERAIRAQKRKILIDKATGDAENLETDQIKLQLLRQDYKAFSKAAGLRMQHERLEKVGFAWKEATEANNTFLKTFTNEPSRAIMNKREMANGLRNNPDLHLTEEQIVSLKGDIRAIGADESVFAFNVKGSRTAYHDGADMITVCGDVLPDLRSRHPRDRMSSKAVLAHEYYGHRANRGTKLPYGDWKDEFRASYMAARDAPGLSDEDRYYLILDALERAREANQPIRYNGFMRRVLYGFSETS